MDQAGQGERKRKREPKIVFEEMEKRGQRLRTFQI